MDAINIILVIVVCFNIFLAYLLLARSRKITNIAYFFVVIGVIFWVLSMILYRAATTVEASVFWCRVLYIAATFTASPFVYFTFIFPKGKRSFLRTLLIFIPQILLIILIILPDYIIENVAFIPGEEKFIDFGSLYYLYALYISGYFSLGLINLLRKYFSKQYSPAEKSQIKYVFWGYFLASNFAMSTNLIMPWMGNFVFNWLGQILALFMGGFTVFAIIRYRLMNVSFIITRSLVFFIMTFIVTATFVLVSLLAAIFFADTPGINKYIAWIVASVLIVLLLDPLKAFLAKITDKIFFKGKIDYDEVLRKLTKTLSEEMSVRKIVLETQSQLEDNLKIKKVRVLITSPDNDFLDYQEYEEINGNILKRNRKKKQLQQKKTISSALVKYLTEHKDIIVYDELERMMYDMPDEVEAKKIEKILAEINGLNAALVTPVFKDKNISALILMAAKSSGDVFTNEDIHFLEVVSPQLATSLEKAKLYQEAQKFNVKLQKEVERATKNLKKANVALKQTNVFLAERNSSLNTLQKFSNTILSTLEIDQISQNIINEIPEDIPFCSTALLALTSTDGKQLIGKSISMNTSEAEAIFNLVGKDLSKYCLSIVDGDNLLAKAVIQRKEQISSRLSDFLSPPLPAVLVKKIDSLKPRMKTGMVYPLIAGDRVLGVIHFSLLKAKEDLSQDDLRLLSVVANQMGLALERAEVYNKVKEINKKLIEVNEHLKELDTAKSEFMSITSHQLRTPLSGIMGYLSMIIEGDYGKLSRKQIPIMKEVFDASRRLIRMVNLFLNIARIEAGRFNFSWAKANLVEVSARQLHELKPTADKKNIKLILNEPEQTIPEVTVDMDKIQDVILNLVDNAIKYTDKGQIELSLKKLDGHVLISVKDTGIGINPKEAPKLFNKFVRGDGMMKVNPNGAGLGLFIAKKIVEGHGGKIWAESKGLGKGSTFNAKIPIEQKNIKK
ncbi:MAG: ATP-binding protein [Patescibacteria group bacterium]|jgi:signal transduction histidine kinase